MNEIPEKDTREVEIDMPDGSTWAVPLHVVANIYANQTTLAGSSDSDAFRQVQYWTAMAHPMKALDRMQYMRWEFLVSHARLVMQGESRIYDEGLAHGAKRIVGA